MLAQSFKAAHHVVNSGEQTMLAILQIKMEWTKESRTPGGSLQRQEYYKPIGIEEDVSLAGDGVFLKKCQYVQQGGIVIGDAEASGRLDQRMHEANRGMPFTGTDQREQRAARLRNQSVNRDKGAFYPIDKLDIPSVEVLEESGQRYRIKWFDSGRGMPRRRGGNEDLYKKGARLAGKPNTCNETAFILAPGQAGLLKYNYRLTSFDGQWYECYYVYVVNVEKLKRNIFLREYDFVYDRLADLFYTHERLGFPSCPVHDA